MAGVELSFDFSSLQKGIARLEAKAPKALSRGLQTVAEEILRLSQQQVPHDTGYLQNSGSVQSISDREKVVGYHTRYAARLHEHPEYRFRNGRKGKYLENPIKENTRVFLQFFGEQVKRSLEGL